MSANEIFQLLERFTCHGSYAITGKYQEQSAILPVSVNMAVLRIVIIVRITESGNRKRVKMAIIGQKTKRNLSLLKWNRYLLLLTMTGPS